ncbi:hypothetical protein J2792_002356 [Novosphingobium capsulatum]|uniref:CopG-like ribbon-helix-helix domain-containing protein n=1 Tax=Novosphingobium capsulatum TaxID=13688 RepID=A0ABU1MMC6_9SPHN|nr:hypothetical protein [Novosphingobium capsulatum]MDR6511484.1 hypothetical protein [Novosphingobium capsulatum]
MTRRYGPLPKPPGEKSRRVLITLPPEVLTLIDAQPGDRSTNIAALIRAAYETGA